MNEDLVILADGEFPSHPCPLQILRTASRVVCCDGATDKYVNWGGVPEAIVGDCDSISAENAERFADKLHPDKDQDYNDLTKAVNYCVKIGARSITIVGATGLREDHTIGNISLLADYAQVCHKVQMVSNYGILTAIRSDTSFDSFAGQQISVFSLEPSKQILYEGLKYRLPGDHARSWWSGTLNKSLGAVFTIRCSHPVIVFRKFKID